MNSDCHFLTQYLPRFWFNQNHLQKVTFNNFAKWRPTMFIPKIKEIKKRKVVSRPALNFQKKKNQNAMEYSSLPIFTKKLLIPNKMISRKRHKSHFQAQTDSHLPQFKVTSSYEKTRNTDLTDFMTETNWIFETYTEPSF